MRRLPLAATLAALTLLCAWLLGAGTVHEVQESSASRGVPSVPPPDLAQLPAAPGMRFGIDAQSVERYGEVTGAPPDYGTLWVGKWDLDDGWRGSDAALVALRQANVTPAVQFLYWGDDMAASCLDAGCNGKDTAHWDELAQELAQHLADDLQGAPALVILESEFNKHGVHESEVLDGLLADKASYLKQAYPPAQVVLGLGDWYPEAWATWARAAAACDLVGLQALAASTSGDLGEQDLANAT